MNLPMLVSGPAAQVEDTDVYGITTWLKKWGANTSLTNARASAGPLAVNAGKDVVISTDASLAYNSGLVFFGPNLSHADYALTVPPNITSVSQLKGDSIGVVSTTAPDAILMSLALKNAGIATNSVHIVYTGTIAASAALLEAGRIKATFLDSLTFLGLKGNWHAIATAATIAPLMYDSFLAATPAWIKANPAEAEAFDLAWLAESKMFNTDEAGWVAQAKVYTQNINSTAYYENVYARVKYENGYPTTPSIFSASAVNYNVNLDKRFNLITTTRSSNVVNLGPWDAATKVYAADSAAF